MFIAGSPLFTELPATGHAARERFFAAVSHLEPRGAWQDLVVITTNRAKPYRPHPSGASTLIAPSVA